MRKKEYGKLTPMVKVETKKKTVYKRIHSLGEIDIKDLGRTDIIQELTEKITRQRENSQNAYALREGLVKICGVVVKADKCEEKSVKLSDEELRVITDALIKYFEEKVKWE